MRKGQQQLLSTGFVVLAVGLLLFCGGCTDRATDDFPDGGSKSDTTPGNDFTAAMICTDPNGDDDGDGIPNGEEGCLFGRDSDGDNIPDWLDHDSDNDGIPDSIEAGPKDSNGKCATAKPPHDRWPCDHDGDQFPDYLDLDSDNDGLKDGDEDMNGDGLLGCCLSKCNTPGSEAQKSCILNDDGCGAGQKCVAGACTPPIAFSCSNGETDPKKADTFGDGKLDSERGSFICRDATEDNPKGRKPIAQRSSLTGDWHIALEKTAKYGELVLTNPGPKMAAAMIDEDASTTEVAGFVLSRDTNKADVQDELTDILGALNAKVPGGSGTVSVRASGTEVYSHDSYESVQGTILDIKLTSASNVSTVRNELVATLLGKAMGGLGNLPQPYGTSTTDFVIRLLTLKRVELVRDSKGNVELDDKGIPKETGDQTKWRLMVMGAVAALGNYQDASKHTGFIVEDLSNGTALAKYSDRVGDECNVGTITSLPVADIIWVVDESGSMNDNRQDIVNNANNFFSRALSSGLDFRMCVTGVCNPNSYSKTNCPDEVIGKCCSEASVNQYHLGGVDRFLLPSEQSIFSACINNPPGYEGGSEYGLENALAAVTKHLPRDGSAQDKIRPNATLVIIVATDEIPNELIGILGYSDYKTCTLDATKQAAVNNAIQPYLNMFTGVTDPEGVAMFHVIGGVCNNSCGADVAHGYRELAILLGGQVGDVCQKDIGNTMQVIVDSIVGKASPVGLEHVPISASLAVALDGQEISRSRSSGFDYRSANNTLAFINVKYDKGSEVVASYKLWRAQLGPDF